MPVSHSHYYVIGSRWTPLHPRAPEMTRPDYIISTRQTDYHSVTSRTDKSPKLLEKYCNAIGCCNATIMAIMAPLNLLSMELISFLLQC